MIELLNNFGWKFYSLIGLTSIPNCLIGISIVVGAIGIYLYWLLFHKPALYYRDADAIGFNHVKEQFRSNDLKTKAVNRYLRLRKNGQKLPPPYPNGWFCIAMSDEIQKKQVKNVNVLGENLVVFRTESGVVNVFDAYCPHLGANLGVGGKVVGECIECPFHLWSFRCSDGECVDVPYSSAETFPKSSKLKKWKSCEVNQGIFLWHHAENEEPWELPVINEIESNQWVYNGRNEFYINCHIQEIPENGADIAHLNALHVRNILEGNDLRFLQPVSGIQIGVHTWNAVWKISEGLKNGHIAEVDMKHTIKICDKLELFPVDVKVLQFGPGLVHLLFNTNYGPFAIVQSVVPVEPLVQRVIHRVYAPNTLKMRIASRISLWGETIMFERDVMIWNSKQYVDNPCLVKEDKLIKVFRKWYSQFYSENSKSFQESKQTSLDW